MDIPGLGTLAAAGAVAAMIALGNNDPSSANPIGARQTLPDAGGTVAAYSVTALTPSVDPVPVRGRLYQATVTVEAQHGTVTPMVGCFNARTADGQSYPALDVTTAQGLSRDTVPQGRRATGRLYFDVVGQAPDTVVCNNGMADVLVWEATSPVTPAPPAPTAPPDNGTVSI